jgi:hypothetical protein
MIIRDFKAYDGMQIVPSVLVGPMRTFLQSQGIAPGAVMDDGSIDPGSLLSLFYNKIEIRTSVTEPVTIDLLAPADPSTNQLVKDLQPAVILSGRVGTTTIAPYGVPWSINARIQKAPLTIGVGIGVGLLGIMLVGRALF